MAMDRVRVKVNVQDQDHCEVAARRFAAGSACLAGSRHSDGPCPEENQDAATQLRLLRSSVKYNVAGRCTST